MRQGVAALGLCSWDRFLVTDEYPDRGEYTIVRERFEQAGGTTGNTCHALARLGIDVTLASVVGNDLEGDSLIESLQEAGCDTRHIARRRDERSDSGVIVVSGAIGSRDRTIYWIQGTRPRAGDPLPVDELLEYQWVLLDVDDVRLRAFFLDLPAHRSPRTKLFGTMTYLVEMPRDDAWQHLLRHDAITGNIREFLTISGTSNVEEAVNRAKSELKLNACNVIFVSNGHDGAMAIRSEGVLRSPAFTVDVIDTTGAGDAFAAGCLSGLLDRLDDDEILRRANALGGLACRALGARTALPSPTEVERLLRTGVAGA